MKAKNIIFTLLAAYAICCGMMLREVVLVRNINSHTHHVEMPDNYVTGQL